MVSKKFSIHVSRGKSTAEAHDRRTYTPDSADASLAGRNDILCDVGNFRRAVNGELRNVITEYNERRAVEGIRKSAEIKAYNDEVAAYNAEHEGEEGFVPRRPRRFHPEKYKAKPYDYFGEVLRSGYSNDQQPTCEYVIGFGRHEVCGVCDEAFDADHWHDLKKSGDTEAASAYVAEHLSTGERGAAHDLALEMCRELGQHIARCPHDFLPVGAKLLMVVLHDDEPAGIPHLHVVFSPFAEGYKTGLAKRISLSRCFHDAGYEGKRYMQEWQNDMKLKMEDVLHAHGAEREVVGDTRAHEELPAYRERRRAERARAEADKADAELGRLRVASAHAEAELERTTAEAELARGRALTALDETRRLKDERSSMRAELADMMRLNKVLRFGYRPPSWAHFIAEERLEGELARAYFALGKVPDDELDAQLDLIEDLALDAYDGKDGDEVMVCETGKHRGLWIVDRDAVPSNPERYRDAYDELEALLYTMEQMGIDPTVEHPGVEDVDRRERRVAARERELSERAEAVKSLIDEAGGLVGDLRRASVSLSIGDETLEEAMPLVEDALEATWNDMEAAGELTPSEHYERLRAWGQVRSAFESTVRQPDGTARSNPEFSGFVKHLRRAVTSGVASVRSAYERAVKGIQSGFEERLEALRRRVLSSLMSSHEPSLDDSAVSPQRDDDGLSL